MNRIVLQPKRDYSVIHRHPWIFSGAVKAVVGSPVAGEMVEVVDAKGVKLGYASYSPQSQIRARMIKYAPVEARSGKIGECDPPDSAYVRQLVVDAVARRNGLPERFGSNAMRLVHGESDLLPGVVADIYGDVVVVQLSSAGADAMRAEVADALMEVTGCRSVYERSDVDSRRREGLEERAGLIKGEEPPERIEIKEGSIRYYVDVRKGHKTGFYLDQREARAEVGGYAAGRNCLNCFSYTGGFGLACAANGASSVENLDISQPALDLAKDNFALTFPGGCDSEVVFTCADVFKQLRLYRDQGRKFGLIVLDPPKFADTKSQLMHAARGYKDINLLAMKLLEPGGILATFSCSGAMTTEFFDKICLEAAFDSRREFQVLSRTRQAPDHPVSLSFPEGMYLKGLILRAVS